MRKKGIYALLAVLIVAMGIPMSSFAQTGLASTHNLNDLPVNQVKVDRLHLKDAAFSTTNSNIKLGPVTWMQNGEYYTQPTIYYQGSVNYGTANRTSTTDAVMADTNVSGSFSLRWNGKATLQDDTKADVILTFSNWTISLGAKDQNANAAVIVPIVGTSIDGNNLSLLSQTPMNSTTAQTALNTNIGNAINCTVKIVKSGTNDPVDCDAMLMGLVDFDTPSHSIATGKTDAERLAGKWSEGAAFVSGYKSPYYVSTTTKTTSQTVDGNQKIRGTEKAQNDNDNTGFIAAADPKGYTFRWYGSAVSISRMVTDFDSVKNVTVTATAGKGGTIEKKGATTYALNWATTYDYTPERGYTVKSLKVDGKDVSFSSTGGVYRFDKLTTDRTIDVQFQGPKVTYKWGGEHPDKPVPSGGEITPGEYDVDATYKVGDRIDTPDADIPGFWTFEGWDKTGPLEVYEDTVITGVWTYTPYVNVAYEWEGEHPAKDVPEKDANKDPGSMHEVDTTYQKGDSVPDTNVTYDGTTYPRGTWTFGGWDKDGIITVNEDTIIKGKWSFTPEWNIDTAAENGTITESENNIHNGENRTVSYKPNDGYQLKTLTIDGESVDIKEHPESYTFEDISADHTVNAVFELIPKLELEKTADKANYNAGDTITYTVSLKQTVEGAEARDVKIVDVIPDGLDYVADSLKVPENVEIKKANEHRYELYMTSLTDDITYTYQCVADPNEEGAAINYISATGSNVPEKAEAEASVDIKIPKPDMKKTVSKATAEYGETLKYTITVVQDEELTDARNIVITDKIPEGITLDEDSIKITGDEATYEVKDGVLTVNLPTMPNGVTITYEGKVNVMKGDIVNTAVISGDDFGEQEASVTTTVPEPAFEIEKWVNKDTAQVGDTVTYNIRVTELNGVHVIDGVITDTPADGIAVDKSSIKADGLKVSTANGKLTFTGDFDDEVTITYKATVTKEGELKNVASVTAKNYTGDPQEDDAIVTGKAAGTMPTPKTGDMVLIALLILGASFFMARRTKEVYDE